MWENSCDTREQNNNQHPPGGIIGVVFVKHGTWNVRTKMLGSPDCHDSKPGRHHWSTDAHSGLTGTCVSLHKHISVAHRAPIPPGSLEAFLSLRQNKRHTTTFESACRQRTWTGWIPAPHSLALRHISESSRSTSTPGPSSGSAPVSPTGEPKRSAAQPADSSPGARFSSAHCCQRPRWGRLLLVPTPTPRLRVRLLSYGVLHLVDSTPPTHQS